MLSTLLSNLKFNTAAIVLLLPYILNSQTKTFSEVFELPIKNGMETRLHKEAIVTSKNDSLIYYTFRNPPNSKCNIIIYSFNIKTKSTGQFEIERTDKTKNIFSQRIFSFIVIKQKLILVNDDDIYAFTITKDKLVLSNVQKNKKSYRNIYLLNNNECLLYQNYNFHPLDQIEKHIWAKYYLSNDSLSDFLNMSEDNARFSSLFNSWMSVYKGLIAYSSTSKYSIEFYDSNFKKIDSIQTHELDSNNKYLDQIPEGFSKDAIYQTIKLDDSLLTRIGKIYLIDSLHLLAILKFPNKFKPKNYRLDFWEKVNGTWTKIKYEYHESFYIEGSNYDSDNQPLTGFYGNYMGIEIINRDFYFISYPFIEKCVTKSFERNKDYESKVNNLIKSEKLNFGILKLKLNL
jgi:hypothetical protein